MPGKTSEPVAEVGGNDGFFGIKFGQAHFCREAEASKDKIGAKIEANARLADVDVGPICMRYGVGVDTGAVVGKDGVEAKFLGTGFKIGKKVELMCFGSGVSLDLEKVGDMFKK